MTFNASAAFSAAASPPPRVSGKVSPAIQMREQRSFSEMNSPGGETNIDLSAAFRQPLLPAQIPEDKDEDAMSSSRVNQNRDSQGLAHSVKQRTRELMGRAIRSALVNKKK